MVFIELLGTLFNYWLNDLFRLDSKPLMRQAPEIKRDAGVVTSFPGKLTREKRHALNSAVVF